MTDSDDRPTDAEDPDPDGDADARAGAEAEDGADAPPSNDAPHEGDGQDQTPSEGEAEGTERDAGAESTPADGPVDHEGGAMSTPLAHRADAEEAGEPETETPYLLGLAGGVVAWLLGYLAVYLAYGDRVRGSIGGQLLSELAGGDATWKLVGWLFLNAHFVDVIFDAPVLGVRALDLIGQEAGAAIYLYVVPPIFLLAAGLLVGYRAGTEGLGDAVVTGFLLIPGYLVLSAAGAFLFEVGGGTVTAAPDPVTAILLAGLVYPAVLGGIGSAIGDQL